MKRYDVVVPHKYTKDGEEKTNWKNVGTLVKFDANGDKPESFILEMNMYPDTAFKVFEQKPRTESTSASAPTAEDSPF
jgi:hypothetical protein